LGHHLSSSAVLISGYVPLVLLTFVGQSRDGGQWNAIEKNQQTCFHGVFSFSGGVFSPAGFGDVSPPFTNSLDPTPSSDSAPSSH
jgi:hypothetical protein